MKSMCNMFFPEQPKSTICLHQQRWQTLRRWLNRGVKNAPYCRQSYDSDTFQWILACMDEIKRTGKPLRYDF